MLSRRLRMGSKRIVPVVSVNSSHPITGNTGAINGVSAGDVAIILQAYNSTDKTLAAPTFASGSGTITPGQSYSDGSAYSFRWDIAVISSAPGNSVTFNIGNSGSSSLHSTVIVYRGVSNSSPLDVTPPSMATFTGTGKIDSPSVTMSHAGSVVAVGCQFAVSYSGASVTGYNTDAVYNSSPPGTICAASLHVDPSMHNPPQWNMSTGTSGGVAATIPLRRA